MVNQFVATWTLFALAILTFSGQFLYLRLISLSLAVTFAAGAYVGAILGSGPALPRLIAGMVGGISISAVSGAFDIWAGHRSKALALLASFGFLMVFQGVVEVLGGGGIRAMSLLFRDAPWNANVLNNPSWLPTAIVGLLVVISLLWLVYRQGGLRLAAVATGDDRDLAKLFGVSVLKTTLSVQLIGGAVGGFAGVLMAVDGGLRPDLGVLPALKAFGVLIAVRSRWWLLFPYSILLVLAESIAAYYIGGHAREAAGLVFLVVVLVGGRQLRFGSASPGESPQ